MADPKNMAIFGTSTGGGLTLAMILRAKAENTPLPAAIAPSTPWSDLADIGDSYKTNEWVDNVLVTWNGWLGDAARLYAGSHDMKEPYHRFMVISTAFLRLSSPPVHVIYSLAIQCAHTANCDALAWKLISISMKGSHMLNSITIPMLQKPRRHLPILPNSSTNT